VKYPENKCPHCVYLTEGEGGNLYYHPTELPHFTTPRGVEVNRERLLSVVEKTDCRWWELDNGESTVVSQCSLNWLRRDLEAALFLAVKRGLISKPEADRNY
jgi:hypothetical protein